MPSTISPEFQAHLDAGSCKLAVMVEITRRIRGLIDPTTAIRMTSYPLPLEFPVDSGVIYYPDDMVLISKIVETIGTDVDHAELTGILKTSRVAMEAIRGQLFLGAELKCFNVIYSHLGYGSHKLKRVFLGDFTLQGDGSWQNAVRGLKNLLSADGQEHYDNYCPKIFGSAECGIDMTGRRHLETIDDVTDGGKTLRFNGRTEADGFYQKSPLICESGDNADITVMVKNSTLVGSDNYLELVAPYPFPIAIGADTFTLEEGDLHTAAACKAKGNFVNFGGYPHTPGNRKISQVGKAGGGKGK
jgi:uncharacterized phage protein (TIGR02218 family)